jgi:hypothetical protein
MTTIDEYMKLYVEKDPKLMDQVGMDKDQRESINSPCKWTAAVLERIGSDLQDDRLAINRYDKYRLAIIMRSANNDCRKCRDC